MADVTRAATPITNRNIIQPQRESRSTNEVPFDFQDTSKVKQAPPQSEMQENANVLRQDGSTTGFYELLHDPEVSSVFLKSIFLLREIVDILPMTNSTQTEEMQQLLNNLVLKPDEIAGEMMRQEDISTLFKGGLFDILRNMIEQNPDGIVTVSNPEVPLMNTADGNVENTSTQSNSQLSSENTTENSAQTTNASANNIQTGNNTQLVTTKDMTQIIANLLKAINSESSKESIFKSVENNLSYIREQVSVSPKLSAKLDSLLEQLENFSNATDGLSKLTSNLNIFSQIKSEILSTFKDIESSIIYNDDIAKSVSIATYNLSRINTSDTAVSDAFSKLLNMVESDEDKENLTNALLKFIEDNNASQSKTMNALTEILKKQSDSPEMKMLNTDSIDKIIHSLLSSPCNFTPLLHYVIPVEYEDIQASAEMWIDPDDNDGNDKSSSSGGNNTHVLVVFEVGGIGKFEAELFVKDKNIDLSVYCPEEFADFYKGITSQLRSDLSFSDYKLKKIDIEKMKSPRSLIEVFKFLPQRRAGVNVTI